MSNDHKDSLARWLPTLIAIIGIGAHVGYIGRWAGGIESRMVALEEGMRQTVPRAEYAARVAARSDEMAQLRESINRFDRKLDALMTGRLMPLQQQYEKKD